MMKTKNKLNSATIFDYVCYLFLGIFALLCFYPFYYLFIYSISDPMQAIRGVYLLPRGFTLDAYASILKRSDIQHAALISLLRTVSGTFISVLFTSLLGFVLSKRKYKTFRILYRVVILTMYFNPGVIPYYITMQRLGLCNSFWIYILPGAVGAFNMILVKTYIESLPGEMEEAAMIDGASYPRIYTQIIMPVCLPILATVGLFSIVGHWNSWYDNFLYVQDSNLKTLQYTLMQYLQQTDKLAKMTSDEMMQYMMQNKTVQLTSQTMRITMSMVTTMPILFAYPLLQKYFVKGIMIGSIKG